MVTSKPSVPAFVRTWGWSSGNKSCEWSCRKEGVAKKATAWVENEYLYCCLSLHKPIAWHSLHKRSVVVASCHRTLWSCMSAARQAGDTVGQSIGLVWEFCFPWRLRPVSCSLLDQLGWHCLYIGSPSWWWVCPSKR